MILFILYVILYKKEAVNISLQILLATYNGEKYVSCLLDSLLNQTYQDFKVIIRDDCSTDKTYSILKKYENKFPDKFKVTQNEIPSKSAKNNFFLLMNETQADYIMFCDQDDFWLPDKIEKTLDLMKKTETDKSLPVLIHTDLYVSNSDLEITCNSFFKYSHIKNEKSLNRAIVQNCVTGCTVMINKALLNFAKNTNGKDVIMHDWWLYLIASAFGEIEFLNEPTLLYRQHENNSVGAKRHLFMSLSDMKNSIDKNLSQASSFYRTFENMLSETQTQLFNDYINIKKLCRLKRLIRLNYHKLYKYPLKKTLIQQLVIFLID